MLTTNGRKSTTGTKSRSKAAVLERKDVAKAKTAKTMAIVHGHGMTNSINLWLVQENSSCYDFDSYFTNDNHYFDGMELISVPPVICEDIPF